MFFSLRGVGFDRQRMHRWHLAVAALIGLASVLIGRTWVEAGDTIYFNDGMRTVCEGNAFEKGGEIHCEYDGGLLVYRKSDVARIEKGRSVEPESDATPVQETAPAPAGPTSPPPPREPVVASPAPLQRPVGVAFYDPRRPKKYWTSETRHHDSFQDAVRALAEEFKRPASWIEENMGDSNELGDIRETLSSRLSESSATGAGSARAPEARMEFYNPRRAPKYMTGPNARHDGFQDALNALAREFNQPPEWVEQNMGDSNDVDQIRENLRKGAREAGTDK